MRDFKLEWLGKACGDVATAIVAAAGPSFAEVISRLSNSQAPAQIRRTKRKARYSMHKHNYENSAAIRQNPPVNVIIVNNKNG